MEKSVIGPALNDERAVYEWVRDFGFQNENITPFNVVSENKLGGVNQYTFNFNNTANESYRQVIPTEVRLNPKDVFFCYRMGMFVSRRAVDAQGIPTEYAIRRTWANPKLFPGAEANAVKNLYSGQYNLDIGSTKLYIGKPMDQFWRVPQYEENLAISSVAVTGVKAYDDFELDAFYKQTVPGFFITGDDAAYLTLNINQGISVANAGAVAQGTENTIITVLKGFKVSNASGLFYKLINKM